MKLEFWKFIHKALNSKVWALLAACLSFYILMHKCVRSSEQFTELVTLLANCGLYKRKDLRWWSFLPLKAQRLDLSSGSTSSVTLFPKRPNRLFTVNGSFWRVTVSCVEESEIVLLSIWGITFEHMLSTTDEHSVKRRQPMQNCWNRKEKKAQSYC